VVTSGPPGFRQVLGFHGHHLLTAARAWGVLAARVRQRADELAGPLHRAEDVWAGPAAALALPRTRRLVATLDTAGSPLRAHEEILSATAGAAARLRDRARELVARAAAAGVSIDLDGRVAPAGIAAEFAGRAVESFRHQVGEVLAEAARLDREAVRQLTRHAPWVPGGSRAFVPRAAVPGPGTDPAAVHRWWQGLTPAQWRYLIMEHPGLLGALDGVPVAVRDQANRLVLARERERLAAHDRRRPALDLLAARLSDPPAGGQRAYLLGLDLRGDGRVVLALGNPDRADNVLTFVPGAGAALAGLGGDLRRTELMAADLSRLGGGKRTAVVYWLDYDAPDWAAGNNPVSGRAAVEASEGLRSYADGLRATHTGDGSRNTYLGHSYGSTVVGRAAVGGLSADSLIFLGSPGVVARTTADLDVDARHVWAATTGDDPIRFVPDRVHGPDPSDPDFGARIFAAGPDGGHAGYWDAASPARDNVALIALGRYRQVPQ
jgi:hypothetical protein